MAGILENSLKFSKPRKIDFVANVHNTQYHLLILYLSWTNWQWLWRVPAAAEAGEDSIPLLRGTSG